VSQGLVSRKSECMYLCTDFQRDIVGRSSRLWDKAVHGNVVILGTLLVICSMAVSSWFHMPCGSLDAQVIQPAT
jgi:hypothetical protein